MRYIYTYNNNYIRVGLLLFKPLESSKFNYRLLYNNSSISTI